jgi:hypothetical protein
VRFDLCPGLGGDGLVNHVIENREKFRAGHLVNSVSLARPRATTSA